MRRQLIIAGFTVLACGLAVGLLLLIGQVARLSLMTAERYQLPFQAIDSPTPPGMERGAFLAEVRYYGQLPDPLPLLDDQLSDKLAQAFARHPWVERVEQVQLGPGRRVQVQLRLRTAVLAVRLPDGTIRAVDRSGILLPRGADTHALPLLVATSTPPGPGRPWGDRQVETAAHVAHLLGPYQDEWRFNHFAWQGDVLLLRRGPRSGPVVVWGEADGDHAARLRRLIDSAAKLEAGEGTIDLRE
ncbi:MAG: hypothetical protein N2039_09490 [Gemmataceae bacterium]|nr:hypothetical protein [Gemmataceae bacterium]